MTASGDVFALDIALRGASAVLLLLLAGLLARDHGRSWAARLGALFALGVAAFAAASADGFRPGGSWWQAALAAVSASNNLVFWLFARALFDDDFKPRLWQTAPWAAIAAATFACALWLRPAHSPLVSPIDTGLALSALAFAGLAVLQTFASWRADLIAPRRRLRVLVVGVTAGYVAIIALANLSGVRDQAPEAASLAEAIGLLIITAYVAWSFLGVAGGEALFAMSEPQKAPAPKPELDLADRKVLAAIERAMTVDRAYRQDGLTIGALAAMNKIPEHRLRRLINQGLGRRNFNQFLNRYRIADARAGLADPGQAEVPILTIALDAGFSSLGPFNRTFKLETGLTPSAFRKAALAQSGAVDFKSDRPISKIGARQAV